MQLKVLSWNIWVKSEVRNVIDFLTASKADIIGLQEMQDDEPERKVIPSLEKLGYQSVFMPVTRTWGGKTWNDGPAIFSKYPIIASEKLMLGDDKPRGCVRADIQVGETVLHVFSTHLVHVHQKQDDLQDAQVATLLALLPEDKTIVMGDFNAAPDGSAIKMMTRALNNTDPSNTPTWSVYPEGCHVCDARTIFTRLDYIFTSKDLKTNSPAVGTSTASDHLPISVVVEL